MIYINWILVISAICATVGFCTFVFGAIDFQLHPFTTWSELNRYQMVVAALTILGTTVFVGTMIVAAILKSYQLIG